MTVSENTNVGSIDAKIQNALNKYGYLTHREVAQKFGISLDQVSNLKNNNQILGVRFGKYTHYPTPQFELSMNAMATFIQSLGVLGKTSHMKKLFFYATPQEALEGKTPFDSLLEERHASELLELAEAYAIEN